MAYKLLTLDLDGTTLGPGITILPAVAEAIAAAQAQGVRVTIATGRMYAATVPYARQLHIREHVICYQGALIRDPNDGAIYQHVVMPGDLAAEAIEILRARDLFVMTYIDERLCAAEQRAELDAYLKWHPEGIEVVIDPALEALACARPPTKLLFVAEPHIVVQETARLAAHFAGRLSTVRSHEMFGELTAPGISKGAALASLAAHLGIAREEVVAIGDHENDLPMIEWAGLGLAMGNAIPVVQAAADAVIPAVSEAGVAWAINHYLLER